MNEIGKMSFASVIFVLAACTAPTPKVTEQEALNLLNQGNVTEIGVSHSGWTILTLRDGRHVRNRAEIIGYPGELLKNCKDCSNVAQWIE